MPCNKRDGRARCVGEIGREGLLQAAIGYVEGDPVLRACHDAQATGSRWYLMDRWMMEMRIWPFGPLRSAVPKQCG